MSSFFECPYLGRLVELTDEREAHILLRHPDLMIQNSHLISSTLGDPDAVYSSDRPDTLLFLRWYDELADYVIVVVVGEILVESRAWIVTAHTSRYRIKEESLWERS